MKITKFMRKILISGNYAKKTHVSERGRHFCELCEKDARFPRVEFVDVSNNSLNLHEKTYKFTKFPRKNAQVH